MDGDTEGLRRSADERLREAWVQGRIDASEHERRTTALKRATTPDEIAAVERGDLREFGGGMHTGGGIGTIPSDGIERRVAGSSLAGSSRRLLSPQMRGAIATVTPMVALILFFATKGGDFPAWIWFLCIPVVYTLLGASDEHDERRRRKNRSRELKRARLR